MNVNASNLFSLSKNKYNINLLDTIEHKELFKNLNKNINQNQYNNSYNINNNENNQNNNIIENDYYIINDENSNNKKIGEDNKNNDENIYLQDLTNESNHYIKYNPAKKIINNAKIDSKSFKDIVKNKLDNFQELFTKLSPDKNKRCLSQDNSQNKKAKKDKKVGKKYSDENNLINIKEFNFERNNNNNLPNKQKDNIYYYSNDFKKNNQNISYFKNSKKEQSNISKNSTNSYIKQIETNNLDVYNRLYNKSFYNKKKNNINNNEENNCTFNPQLLSNLKSKKNNDCLENFIQRQERFNKYINQKKINLKKDIIKNESKKYTFTPNTSCTSGSKYSIKLEAERQDESKLDKANRMVYDSMKKIEDKNNHLFLMYNTQYSFIPSINKNKNINYKSSSNNKNNINNSKTKEKKENSIKKEENKNIKKIKNKYVNHQYDNIKSNYKNDKELMNRINEENNKRIKRINNMRKEQENEYLERYRFKPDLIKENNSYYINFLNHNNENIYCNNNLNREMTYVDFYNKKKYFKNKLNRSQSYSRNNWYINSNINYNNYSSNNNNFPDNSNNCFSNTYFQKDNYNFTEKNNYNKYNINYNDCNDYLEQADNIDNNKFYDLNNYNNCDNNDENYEDFRECKEGRKSFNDNNYYNNKKDNLINLTPKSDKAYYTDNKYKVIDNIKKEDKQNFLLIHKLLYN